MGSPRTRITPGFDGVLAGGGESWTARRRASEGLSRAGMVASRDENGIDHGPDIREESEHDMQAAHDGRNDIRGLQGSLGQLHISDNSNYNGNQYHGDPAPNLTVDLENVEWTYRDPQGQTQGTLSQ